MILVSSPSWVESQSMSWSRRVGRVKGGGAASTYMFFSLLFFLGLVLRVLNQMCYIILRDPEGKIIQACIISLCHTCTR